MKVAICFSGLVRTFKECFPTYSRIRDLYDCDLFAVSTPNDILKDYPFKSVLQQEDVWIEEKHYSFKSPETIVQNSLRQFLFIELCNNLRIQAGHYDFIIRTRFDNILINNIPDLHQCDPHSIYIPSGHDHPMSLPGVGINDRFAFGGDSVMNIYSNKLRQIDQFMAQGKRFHPETILKWILDQNNLNIIRFEECSKINRGNNEFL